MKKRINIAIMAGGNSSEVAVSLKGAKQIARWLDKDKYNVYTIIVKGTKWTLKHPKKGNIAVSWDTFTAEVNGKKLKFHCALIAIHGKPGETGHLQGYFEMMGIPYTTGGLMNTALTFDKEVTKRMVSDMNIELAKTIRVIKGQEANPNEIVEKLSLPVFVKPNESGSSYGITKVKAIEDLDAAFNAAFTEDRIALVEEFIPGVELTCGLIKTKNKTLVFPVTEIVPKNEYFDYDAKYKKQSDEITPARITDDLADYIQSISSEIYDRLKCRGIVRIDYIYGNNKLYFLEVNTVPGMSETSLVPQQVEAMGLTMSEIFSMVIEDALNRE